MEENIFSLQDIQVFQRELEVQQQRIQQHSQEILRFEKDLQVLYKKHIHQITSSQYQSFQKRLGLLKRESSQRALSIQTMIQKYQNIYIASVQYIISTQRCPSFDGHLSFSKGELLNVEE